MKLTFSTLACPNWSWDLILDHAVRFGFDSIEIRGIESELDLGRMKPFLPDQAEETRTSSRNSDWRSVALERPSRFMTRMHMTEQSRKDGLD